jgi:hypothetical protein
MRYTVSLQDTVDLCCYKDFHEFSSLEEAKREADETAEKKQRSVIVFDNKYYEIVYKKAIEKKDVVKQAPTPLPKRGRKKKEEVKKDKYFD